MASDNVLRIPRGDNPGDYILLNTSSNGSLPLDLKLLATEGSQPYLKTLKHSRISKYRAKSNPLTDAQWETLLRSTLLQERAQQQDLEAEEALKDIELVAALSYTNLTITLRKSISGIHQRLGDLTLPASPDTDINVLDWCATAITRADTLFTQSQALEQEIAEQTQVVDRLRTQLEELIQAKKEHEDALLQKCAILINEKKAKIRDQQRLLATSKPDPDAVKKAQSARARALAGGVGSKRSPKASRRGKRKASAPVSASGSDEDGFEDIVKIEDEADIKGEERRDSEDVTPQHTDLDETEDEASGEEEDVVPAAAGSKGRTLERAEGDGMSDEENAPIREEKKGEEMPPPRALPFREDTGDAGQETMGGEDTKMADDNDETDDDEL
ncbi:MAG: hypothetical protein Q9218_002010 [Villophora microphyllina]